MFTSSSGTIRHITMLPLLFLLFPSVLTQTCFVNESWGNLTYSFVNAATFSTDDFFEIIGTITADGCASFRAYQTIESNTTSCFAAPVEITQQVETVTYIYEDCPLTWNGTVTVVCCPLQQRFKVERGTMDTDG